MVKLRIPKVLRSPRVLMALAGRSTGAIIIAVAVVMVMPFLVGYGLLDEGEGIEDVFSLIQILLGSD